MKRLTFLLLVAIILLPVFVSGQEAKRDTTFFSCGKYRTGQSMRPEEGWAEYDSLIAVSQDYDLIYGGTADMETRVYKNLKEGTPYEDILQYPFNQGYSWKRANAAKNRAGCDGKIETKVVDKKEKRGIYLIRIPKKPAGPKIVEEEKEKEVEAEIKNCSVRFYSELANKLNMKVSLKTLVDDKMIDVDSLYLDLDNGQKMILPMGSTFTATFEVIGDSAETYKSFETTFHIPKDCGEMYVKGEPERKLKIPSPPKNELPKTTKDFAVGFYDGKGRAGGGWLKEYPSRFTTGLYIFGQNWNGDSQIAGEIFLGYKFLGPVSFVSSFSAETQLYDLWDKFSWNNGLMINQPILWRFNLFANAGCTMTFVHQHVQYGNWDFYNGSQDPYVVHIKRPVQVPEKRFWKDLDWFMRVGITINLF